MEGDAAIAFDPDQTVRTFTFDYTTSLDLSGPSQTAYTVSVTGTAGYGTVVSAKSDFTLTVKNPCIDPDYITITSVPLP